MFNYQRVLEWDRLGQLPCHTEAGRELLKRAKIDRLEVLYPMVCVPAIAILALLFWYAGYSAVRTILALPIIVLVLGAIYAYVDYGVNITPLPDYIRQHERAAECLELSPAILAKLKYQDLRAAAEKKLYSLALQIVNSESVFGRDHEMTIYSRSLMRTAFDAFRALGWIDIDARYKKYFPKDSPTL